MTLTEAAMIRRADAWAALEPAQQRRTVRAHAYHLAVYAQAIGFRSAHPPKEPPEGRVNWESLDNVPSAEWESVTA